MSDQQFPYRFGGFHSLVDDLDRRHIRNYRDKVLRWTPEDEANLARRVRRLVAALTLCLLLAGCLNGQNVTGNAVSNVYYFHDDAHAVGCWYFSAGGVFCLPDKDYQR